MHDILKSHRWSDLEGTLNSDPAATSWGEGRLDCFVQGIDGSLWHRWFDDEWHEWENLGGVLTSAPAAASWAPGRVDCFVRGSNSHMWHRWFDGEWRDWEDLGGVLVSAPAVASWGTGRLDCFVQGTDNHLWHRWFEGGWSDWEDLGGFLTSSPAVTSSGAHRLDCFARGSDRHLWRRRFDSGWSDWEDLGGDLASAPSAASSAAGRIDCLVQGTDNRLWQISISDRMSNWKDLGAAMRSAPAMTSSGAGKLDCFVRGTENQLWHASFDADALEVAADMQGPLVPPVPPLTPTSGIAAVSRIPGSVEMWSVSYDKTIQGAFWYEGQEGWTRYQIVPRNQTVEASPQGGVAAVSRRPETMEILWIGADGSVWDAHWYEGFTEWRCSQLAPPGSAALTSGIAALSRRPETLEIWWIAPDSSVWNAHWYEGFTEWKSYQLAAPGSAALASGIAAVSRLPETMEIWWIGTDGSVWDAHWYEGFTGWKSFQLAPPGSASQRSGVAAVSRQPNTLEIWWISPDGAVKDAHWYEGFTAWKTFELAPRGRAAGTSRITAVARRPWAIELWWVAPDGSLWDAYWHEGGNWIQYAVPAPHNVPRASVRGGIAAVSRVPESIEVFAVGEESSLVNASWHDESRKWDCERVPSAGRAIDVFIHELVCSRATSNDDRDEVYMEVRSSTPKGLGSVRLPRHVDDGDYYEFNSGRKAHSGDLSSWTNRDGFPLGPARIWSGVLLPGQSAEFVVLVMEQDNDKLQAIKRIVKGALDAIEPLVPKDPKWQAAYRAAKFLSDQLPETSKHDFIGMFAIRVTLDRETEDVGMIVLPAPEVKLEDGQVATASSAGSDTPFAEALAQSGQAAVTVTMNGTNSCSYQAAVLARHAPLPRKALRFAGKTEDNCGGTILAIDGREERVHLAKGQSAEIPVPPGGVKFNWYCDGSPEKTRPENGATTVIAKRAPDGREIRWSCFVEEEF